MLIRKDYVKELSGRDILKGQFTWPRTPITLMYTKHATERLEERGGIPILPKSITITDRMIYSGKIDSDGKIVSMVIRIRYTEKRFLYLCLNPFDGAVKSMWFKNVVYVDS